MGWPQIYCVKIHKKLQQSRVLCHHSDVLSPSAYYHCDVCCVVELVNCKQSPESVIELFTLVLNQICQNNNYYNKTCSSLQMCSCQTHAKWTPHSINGVFKGACKVVRLLYSFSLSLQKKHQKWWCTMAIVVQHSWCWNSTAKLWKMHSELCTWTIILWRLVESFSSRPGTIHWCTSTSWYFLPRYEYHIYWTNYRNIYNTFTYADQQTWESTVFN